MNLTDRLAARGLSADYKPIRGAEAFMAGELDDAHLLAEHRASRRGRTRRSAGTPCSRRTLRSVYDERERRLARAMSVRRGGRSGASS